MNSSEFVSAGSKMEKFVYYNAFSISLFFWHQIKRGAICFGPHLQGLFWQLLLLKHLCTVLAKIDVALFET